MSRLIETDVSGAFSFPEMKTAKHLPGQHDQMTHAHGGSGHAAGIDTAGWPTHNTATWAAKKIAAMEALAEAGDWDSLASMKFSKSVYQTGKFGQAIQDAKANLLAKKDAASVAQALPVKLKADGGLVVASGWQQTGPKLGTQPGGKYLAEDGKEYYVKFPGDPDMARSEVMANKLYEAAGASVPAAHLVLMGTKVGIATEWDGSAQKADWGSADAKAAAAKDFAAHAWTANWDCVGAGGENPMDNIRMSGGKAVSVDVGGALAYSGSGGKKPFGPDVTEWDTLRDGSINPSAAKVFKDMTKDQLVASAKKLEMVSDEAIHAIANKHAPYNADPGKMAETLIARKNGILAKAAELGAGTAISKKVTAVEKPDGSWAKSTPVAPSVLPPPKVTSSTNAPHWQPKFDAMHEAASKGDWAKVEAMQTSGSTKNGYGKKLHEYKQQLLIAKEGGGHVMPAKPAEGLAQPKVALKVDPTLFPSKPMFASKNMDQVKANEAAAEKMLEHAKAGDLSALKAMAVSPSPKLKAFHEEVMTNLSDQLNPPPPPVKVSGKLLEVSEKCKAVCNAKEKTKVGKYIILGDAGNPVPGDYVIEGTWKDSGDPKLWKAGQTSYNKLPKSSKDALKSYTGQGYHKMNSELRGFEKLSSNTSQAVSGLHHAAIPVPVGTKLARKLSMDSSEIAKLSGLEGFILQDRGIISTTTRSNMGGGSVKWDFTAGPGVRALPAKNFSHYESENEYLLPANSRFLVTKVSSSSDGVKIQATILPWQESQCCPP